VLRPLVAALEFLGERGLPLLVLGIGLGFVAQPLAEAAWPLLLPAIFLPVVLSLMRLDLDAVRRHARRPLLSLAVVAWALLACPFLAAAAGEVFQLPAPLRMSLILMGCASPLLSAPALAFLIGLDAELTTLLVLLGMALSPFTIPPIVALLIGPALEIGTLALATRFLFFIGVAFVAAFVLRRTLDEGLIRRSGKLLDGVSIFCLLVFIVAIMRGVPQIFRDDPSYAILTTVAAFVANLVLNLLGVLLFRRAGLRESFAIGLVSANRNIGVIAAVLADQLSQQVLFYIAVGQLPMFLFPLVLPRLYRAALARGTS
jgi:bile acid:Na+ symporter, BASS family